MDYRFSSLLTNYNRPQVRSISSQEIVEITNTDHSSCWFYPEDVNRLQVYVKPINNNEQWNCEGIAVLAKYLMEYNPNLSIPNSQAGDLFDNKNLSDLQTEGFE